MTYILLIVASLFLTTAQAQVPQLKPVASPAKAVPFLLAEVAMPETKPAPGTALIEKMQGSDLDGPGFYYLLLGNLYSASGQWENATQAFAQALRHTGDEALLRQLTKNSQATTTGFHFDIVQPTPEEQETFTAIASGLSLLTLDDPKLEKTVLRMLAEVEQVPRLRLTTTELRLFYVQKLLSLKKNDAARAELLALVKSNPNNPKLWYALALLDKDAKRWEQALAHLEKALPLLQTPVERVQSQTLILYTGLESPNKAIQKKAYALLRPLLTNPKPPLDLLAPLSVLAQRLGDEENAFALLERLVVARPQDPNALNTLGYILANNNRSLERAQSLIQQALTLSPQSPEILDSMGWVEYRRGKLKKAQEHLERAYALLPIAEIAAHLGEVYWALGKKDQAQTIWQKALNNQPDAVLRETIRRLMPDLKPWPLDQ